MSEGTKIQWCDDTHNFWRGCVKVSPGCKNCYAEVSTPVRVARSEGRELWGGTLRDRAKDFDAPLRWNDKPCICEGCGKALTLEENLFHRHDGRIPKWHRRRVFSLSLGDWLDDAVPIEWLADMLYVIRRCPNLDFLLLTKRPENFQTRVFQACMYHMAHIHATTDEGCELMARNENYKKVRDLVLKKALDEIKAFVSARIDTTEMLCGWFRDIWENCDPIAPPNIWIGCTVENQEYADKRIPELLKIPAVCRFISYEPALGPVDFGKWIRLTNAPVRNTEQMEALIRDRYFAKPEAWALHWIIVGGESGPKARPFDLTWARSTVAQCRAAAVACFVKQMGAHAYDGTQSDEDAGFFFKDKKGGDMAEWPNDLRVREFPNVAYRGSGSTSHPGGTLPLDTASA